MFTLKIEPPAHLVPGRAIAEALRHAADRVETQPVLPDYGCHHDAQDVQMYEWFWGPEEAPPASAPPSKKNRRRR